MQSSPKDFIHVSDCNRKDSKDYTHQLGSLKRSSIHFHRNDYGITKQFHGHGRIRIRSGPSYSKTLLFSLIIYSVERFAILCLAIALPLSASAEIAFAFRHQAVHRTGSSSGDLPKFCEFSSVGRYLRCSVVHNIDVDHWGSSAYLRY